MITKDRVSQAIARSPVIKPVLARLAKRAAAGKKLPETFSATGLDYAAQRELEGLFGTVGQRAADGRVYISVMQPLREPSEWRGLLGVLGVAEKGNGNDDDEDVFARLKLLEPDFEQVLENLAENGEVRRFVSKPANRKPWMALFRGAVGIARGDTGRFLNTLSQLGSDWLGDSKALRSGALRRQLVLIVSAFGGEAQEFDERLTLEHFMIIDNPYTSNVTVFAPIVLILDGDIRLDYPYKLFENGLAATIPLESVSRIKSIEWKGQLCDLVTCENAAPFTDVVVNGQPAVYTAGYPSLAVKMLLYILSSDLGLGCVHLGDADLDGFRIAAELGNYIKVRTVAASEVLRCAKGDDGIALTDDQSKRAWVYLAKHPDFCFADDVKRMLSRGRWIEQESFGSILGNGGRRK